MIFHHLDPQGGFTVGDTETGLTAYAYPTSLGATQARKRPADVAAHMLEREWRPSWARCGEYDARNWAKLGVLS